VWTCWAAAGRGVGEGQIHAGNPNGRKARGETIDDRDAFGCDHGEGAARTTVCASAYSTWSGTTPTASRTSSASGGAMTPAREAGPRLGAPSD